MIRLKHETLLIVEVHVLQFVSLVDQSGKTFHVFRMDILTSKRTVLSAQNA